MSTYFASRSPAIQRTGAFRRLSSRRNRRGRGTASRALGRMREALGPAFDVLAALKQVLDPNGILNPGKVISKSYDITLNGWELASGSIRIHDRQMQERVFAALGIGPEEQQEKFGFLLDAFKYGPPPHGGIAPGIDRIVALAAGETNIREVIAFPKTQSGADPMTNSPQPVEGAQLDALGIRVLPRAT